MNHNYCFSNKKKSNLKKTQILIKKNMFHSYFIALSILLLLPHASSFAGLGHALTGVIASQLLSPDETTYFQQFIDFMAQNYTNIGTMGEATRWCDDIRTQTSAYDYWHYIQNCYSADSMTRCAKVPSPNSFTVLTDSINTMLNETASLNDKGFYFLFLLHLMGDIHQPLHNIRMFSQEYPRGDSGGNAIPITYQNISTNLHEFWDNLCIMKPVNPSRPFSSKPKVQKSMDLLGAQYIANYTFGVDEISFDGNMNTVQSWITQSYGLAVKYAYDPIGLNNGSLTDGYVANCVQVVNRQVALAGFRLGSVLKYLFQQQ